MGCQKLEFKKKKKVIIINGTELVLPDLLLTMLNEGRE